MPDLLGFVVMAAAVAAIAGTLGWLGARARHRGVRGADAIMGPFEEIWHPAAHRARLENQVAEERMIPLAPGEEPERRANPATGAE